MKFALDQTGAQYLIKRYSTGVITVNDTDYPHSLVVGPHVLLTTWAPQTLTELTAGDFYPIMALKPSVIILGVGEQHQFPDFGLLQPLYKAQIGVEVMTTGAACRTYNVLASEGRAVIAALLRG